MLYDFLLNAFKVLQEAYICREKFPYKDYAVITSFEVFRSKQKQ